MPYANRDDQLAYLRDRRHRLRTGEAPPGTPSPYGTRNGHAPPAPPAVDWTPLLAACARLQDALAAERSRQPYVSHQLAGTLVELLHQVLETLPAPAEEPTP